MTESSLVMLAVLAAVAAAFFVSTRYLGGPELSAFDGPGGDPHGLAIEQRFSSGDRPSEEHRAIVAMLSGMPGQGKGFPTPARLARLRTFMDEMFASRHFEALFIPANAGGVSAEWVIAPGASSTRRTLYIHGGAYAAGSPRSHRVITAKFSEITGGAVLAIDYRLMPEHSRMAGIEDCRTAYRWMLEFGPHGAQRADTAFVAGDSAGGNLALSLIAWLRDHGLRAPDAVVALSPLTDSTFGSPSFKTNLATDAMLGPLFKPLARLPRAVLLWVGLFVNRMRPSDPMVSPVFGNLGHLPPLLIHASQAEMLLDDSRRYVRKAVAAGSPARLQTWNHVVHVWHIFDPALPEATQAFEEIRKFLAAAVPATASRP